MKTLILTLVLLFPGLVSAISCLPLYEQEADAIQKKYGYTTYVGGHYYIGYGQLAYWPGVKVNADINNWAEDLVNAIKWGPYFFTPRPEDPRKAWLEVFRKSVKDQCGDLSKNDYKDLRAMLTELMEDGSFCPKDEILKPGLLGNKHSFKKTFEDAVDAGRFPQYCKNIPIKDDSFREQTDEPSRRSSPQSSSGASEQ